MRKAGSGNLLLIGVIFLVLGIFLITPIAKVMGFISLIIGAILAVIAIVRIFSGGGQRSEYE